MPKPRNDSSPRGGPPGRLAVRALVQALLLLFVGAAVVATAYRVAYRVGLDDLRQAAQRRLHFLSADLASALDKFNTLPLVLAGHPDLIDLLRHADDPVRRDSVNRRLQGLADSTHVAAIFLIDASGHTVAASNWATPRSFVGQNYAFRPYFRDAMEQGTGRFFAVGATTGEPGYFLAHRVPDDARSGTAALGVVAVKISLDDIEANWQRGDTMLMLADVHGVVFLASRNEWKFRTLAPLPDAARQQLRVTQQYGDAPLERVPLEGRDAESMRIGLASKPGKLQWLRVSSERRPIGHMDWTLMSFSELDDVVNLASGYAAAAGFACAFMLVVALYARLRRRRDEERLRAKGELERANAQLDQRIAERTAVLLHANEELAGKIEQLDRTQKTLRATQDELIQAGKLTVLGQMAASITHEINQPLAALRALNDNAMVLLSRGDEPAVGENLRTVAGLTQRIASIVAQLKGFARKDDLRQVPVAVLPAIEAAISLVAADAKRHGVRIEVSPMVEGLAVQGQVVRLEQVLVNLLRNGVDACRENGATLVSVRAVLDDGWVAITVADSGPGIAPEALVRLFEPFFTTKQTGDGLGLGLAISGSIANALGGSLGAANRPQGGAEFTLRLRPADSLVHAAHASRTIG